MNFTISNILLNVVSVSVHSLCQRETPNAAQNLSLNIEKIMALANLVVYNTLNRGNKSDLRNL